MNFLNFFQKRKKTNLIKCVSKPDDEVVKYYAIYFIKQLKVKGLTEFNVDGLHALLFLVNVDYYKKNKQFLFDTPLLRENCSLKLLSLRNFLNNLDNVKNADDIVETENLEIDKVLK